MNENKGVVCFLTFNNFPEGDAGSFRLIALAKAVKSCGYCVRIISMGKNISNGWQTLEDNIEFISLRKDGSKIRTISSYIFFNKSAKKILDKTKNLKAIFVCNTLFYVIFNSYLNKLSIPLIYDATEWYNKNEFRFGFFSLEYISNSLIINCIHKPWRIIAISTYLEKHFKQKCINTIRIPAILDLKEENSNQCYSPNRIKKIVYAGSPAKKDALYLILNGINCLEEHEKSKFEFRIIGVTKKEFCKTNKSVCIPKNVVFLGRIAHSLVIDELHNADFSSFVRDNNSRFVKAGFPSKLVESMSCGVPVITNLTSDLNLYLNNGINSIIVDQFTSISYAKALKIALNMNEQESKIMHFNAKSTANSCFDYHQYKDSIQNLIEN